ncbi:MAG: phenylalanine--tRNA ligase subunit beta [Candidatus Thermoplasmatota archaeon]|nr:phenylalanine--tRNA ligase subunit beta [Candidatus Thermoplasmatota archaeon]
MPVINFSYSDLCRLLGMQVSRQTLREKLPMMGADLNSVDEGSDDVSFEFFPDRPDLYSVEGIARALRAFLGKEIGLKSYPVTRSDLSVLVDPSVDDVRPFIWTAVVEGNRIDDALIRSMMDLQEKLHITLGRNRKKVAIGLHDIKEVKPPFTYKAVRPDEITFMPLQGSREMNLKEILEEHEKGKAYAFVLDGKDKYPIILDRDGKVLSFPPIINGITTAVTENTRDIFVDCTGTDANAVMAAVNIIATALAERGGNIKSVSMQQGGSSASAPNLEPRMMNLEIDYVNHLIGIDLDAKGMVDCLRRMGYGATSGDDGLQILIPAYRADIIHPADLAEDVAIGYGFDKFGAELPRKATFGIEDPTIGFSSRVRPILTGLGYLEIVTLSLSNPRDQYEFMGQPVRDDAIRIMNPVSEDHVQIRTSLIPSILTMLKKNKHRELPQRVFEIGDTVRDHRNVTYLSGASIHAKASFTECKSDIQSLMTALDLMVTVEKLDNQAFADGRCASIKHDSGLLGVFGELAPLTIESFELGYPIAAFEFDLESIIRARESQ